MCRPNTPRPSIPVSSSPSPVVSRARREPAQRTAWCLAGCHGSLTYRMNGSGIIRTSLPKERSMQRRTLLLAAFAACTLGPALSDAQTATGKNRVVVQVSDADPAKWNLALNNVRNLQKDL